MSFLLSSPNVEKVGGGLNISVSKLSSEKKDTRKLDKAIGYTPPVGESTNHYKVRIEQCVKTQCGKKRKSMMDLPDWSSAWTFTCSCGPAYYSGAQYRDYSTGMRTQSPICRHIGAALIVHFL